MNKTISIFVLKPELAQIYKLSLQWFDLIVVKLFAVIAVKWLVN